MFCATKFQNSCSIILAAGICNNYRVIGPCTCVGNIIIWIKCYTCSMTSSINLISGNTSATIIFIVNRKFKRLGCLRGLEPPIFGTTTRRFNRLSYRHHIPNNSILYQLIVICQSIDYIVVPHKKLVRGIIDNNFWPSMLMLRVN